MCSAMFRFFLASLLIVNTWDISLGLPLQENATLSTALTKLTEHCENAFLKAQITAKIPECNVVVPPYNEKQFECLIFYDINRQLCDAVSTSKLTLNEENIAKLKEDGNVEKFCAASKEWKVLAMPEYPQYKLRAETVFSSSLRCTKVCGIEDPMSLETNFFCKYYKWGLEMLNQVSTNHLSLKPNVPVGIVAPTVNTVSGIPAVQEATSNGNSVPLLSNQNPVIPPKAQEVDKSTDVKVQQPKIEEMKPDVTPQSSPVQNSGVDFQEYDFKVIKTEKPAVPANVPTKEKDVQPAVVITSEKKNEIEQTDDAMNKIVSEETDQKEPQMAKPQLGDIDPDYQDSEDGKDGFDPRDTDNANDPSFAIETSQGGGLLKFKEVAPSGNTRSFVREELFPNAMPDSFPEDDDHFFPFFLTAVILAVLLYILYHNKSKVSKVVLGLIVEGRQPGRRRNSRGHAYRRLDTLEQAMSTNTAAPPSKIIY